MTKIPGFENYEIDESGLIISKGKWVNSKNGSRAFKKDRTLVPSINNGYPRVALVKNNKAFGFFVHRLVAAIFIPNPENKPCVNHVDFNPLNYHVSNLEWCTRAENLLHSRNHNRYPKGELCYQTKLSNNQVIDIRKEYAHGEITQIELASKYDVHQGTISNIVLNKVFKSVP
jgi:hypothetical protein